MIKSSDVYNMYTKINENVYLIQYTIDLEREFRNL